MEDTTELESKIEAALRCLPGAPFTALYDVII